MKAYTPGPWVVSKGSSEEFPCLRVESKNKHGEVNDGWCIAEVRGSDAEANALLIATAPELLATCEAALKTLNAIPLPFSHQATFDRLVAIIEKATRL